jgi:hypothetical protein
MDVEAYVCLFVCCGKIFLKETICRELLIRAQFRSHALELCLPFDRVHQRLEDVMVGTVDGNLELGRVLEHHFTSSSGLML